ncbi:elongation factor P maturation arginine rhamnosyltransferase EarP [Shewanella rhizosphaerae]|uniref:elongation factor P maturation arginine rhamnosyltransferase EarP n=1 Tax=Shewanella rhizosphaerae TaxID=2864207 RepID=UPI001C65E821|nr:elongation factor P maturation arginine rhamnosyltransferase EarP [Shewanella rhizosphaerae]QYK14761.1 elongation factor P maturation arginine rhamnosyltransferase EarP [Shewanella rhizosphaerae]
MQSQTHANHWDIFCAVVDNYGDIGVTWRLAKQLAKEYGLAVTLWVDDLASFGHILPKLDPLCTNQNFEGVCIKQWDAPLSQEYLPGEVLIEAFACELPPEVLGRIAALHQAGDKVPVWLNLEYLSAEDWVEGCHGLPSLQRSGLKKQFYFPGFTEKTGGLICEADLLERRQAWQDNKERQAYFEALGLSGIDEHDTVISLFSYETESLEALCRHWQDGDKQVHLLVPIGRSLNSLGAFIDQQQALTPGSRFHHGKLTIHLLPMTDQQGYDRLLWSCDFNIVRGEDSFLRAQWAAKPFIWHIYPQEEDYHLIKLEAFMALYCHNLAPEIADAWKKLNICFNQGERETLLSLWQQVDHAHLALTQHAQDWPNEALNDADLATRLVQFVKNS